MATTTTVSTTITDSPSVECADYAKMRARWKICRAARGATEVLCGSAADTYLPQWEAETPKDYEVRKAITFAYDAFAQAESALIGLALGRGIELGTDVPPRIVLDWENIDGQGTHGDIFAQYVAGDALVDGHAGILTEYPEVKSRPNGREEMEGGIRAYLVRIYAEQIINWRITIFGGHEVLSLLVIREGGEEPVGEFGSKPVRRYRVYRLRFRGRDSFGNPIDPYPTYQVFTESVASAGASSVLVPGEETEILGPVRIPFAPVYGGQQEGLLRSLPPLLGLAYSNIRHTQVMSERAVNEHICAVPWRVITGVDPSDKSEIVVSASSATKLGSGATAEILESSGVALSDLLEELRAIEKRMATQAGAMTESQSGAKPTATEVRLGDARDKSKLERLIRSLEDALEASFGFMASYYGLPDGGSVTVRRTFADVLSDDQVRTISETRARGDLTLETWLTILKTGSLPANFDPGQEAEAVKRERSVPDDDPGLLSEEDLTASIGRLTEALAARRMVQPAAATA